MGQGGGRLMSIEPVPAQERAVRGLVTAGGTGLVSAGTGCGKTLMSLWAIDRTAKEEGVEPGDLSVLVVAPLRTESGWRRAVGQVWPGGEMVFRTLSKRRKAEREVLEALLRGDRPRGVSFIGWELLASVSKRKGYDARAGKVKSKASTQVLGGVEFDWVIGDEIHRACNFRTVTSQVLCKIKARHRLALSATPAGGQPVNIFGALKFLWPRKYLGFTRFANTFFQSEPCYFGGPYSVVYGAEKRPGLLSKGHKARGEWQDMRIEDVAGALPPVDIRRVDCAMTAEQRRQYKQLRDEAVAWMGDHPAVVGLPVTRDMRLRQATLGQMRVRPVQGGEDEWLFDPSSRSGKITALLDILKDIGEEKLIVYSPSKKFQVPLVAQLEKAGYSCVRVDGEHKDEWKSFLDKDGPQVLCAVIPAVAEGVDGLQRVCRHEVWMGLDPSVVRCVQAQGRLHRTGQTGTVVRWLLQCPGTVDTESVIPRLDQRYADLKVSGLI